MSESDNVQQLFKDLEVFPKIEEIAKLANGVCAIIHELETQLTEKDEIISRLKEYYE